jgi:type IV pilus assembly protein PilA
MNKRLHTHDGFTLIELLVVILIVGILAAIALPAFLGQREKAQDTDAKSWARNVVSLMEVCYHKDNAYTGCYADYLAEGTGLPLGNGPGHVRVSIEDPQGYQVTGMSMADSGGANHTFTINYNVGGLNNRVCAPAGQGACKADGTW